MPEIREIARLLIVSGIVLVVVGILLSLTGALHVGRLPGDVYFKREHMTFFLPITSCIVVSLIITIILNLFFRSR